ncbi:MAG: hypothetical protein R6U00_10580 [Prochlorococcaceae cyanobacterium]|jgi:hypothetical protein
MAEQLAGGGDEPITPHAAPLVDEAGRLTYVGDDGRRYVVGLPPDVDELGLERVMASVSRGGPLFDQILVLCHRWIASVNSPPDLEARAALALLLTTLETALEDCYGEV